MAGFFTPELGIVIRRRAKTLHQRRERQYGRSRRVSIQNEAQGHAEDCPPDQASSRRYCASRATDCSRSRRLTISTAEWM